MDNDINDISISVSSSSSSSDDSFHSINIPLDETLHTTFSDVVKNFNAVHINAQSIPAHFSDMLDSFTDNNIHAIFVSESWLKPCLPSIAYSLPGFHLIRCDRTGRGGGGVAIYLRTHIPFNIVCSSNSSNEAEFLFLEITLSHSKVLLGVFYSPSSSVDYFSSFEYLLENLTPSFNHTIIMGDFNTCLLKNDSRAYRLKSVASACNLNILPLQATHFFPNCNPSLLDLILVSSPEHVSKFGQHTADAFSFHNLLYLSYKIRPPKLKRRILMQRNFGAIDMDRLRKDASECDWSSIANIGCVNIQIQEFNQLVLDLYDRHAPIRPVRVRHLPAPWLTEDIRAIINKKNNTKTKFKKDPDRYRDNYVRIRNLCNKMCREAQRRHIHKSVENGDPAKVWKFLKSLGVGKKHNESSTSIDIENLNRHFCSSSIVVPNDKLKTLYYLSSLPTPDYTPFVFGQLSDCDVERSLLSISSNALGTDNISRAMIMPILDILLPTITFLFNNSLSSGIFPHIWKEAFIIPLPKKNIPTVFSDYRPISILPFLSKALEKLVHQQLNLFLSKNNLLNPLQSGFRAGHSTTTALVKISDDIRFGMDSSELTVLTLLDFSNAFNTVDFDILLQLMTSLNISPTAIEWFRSYLVGRRQRIRINDSLSSWCSTSAGVPQGGVLSPLLFALFINNITSQLRSSYHLYADDLQIYCRAPLINISVAVNTINEDLERISVWSKSYGLAVNPTKTQVIIIGSPSYISRMALNDLPSVVFNGMKLNYSDRVKNLGICFDSTLSWSPQIAEISRRMFAATGSLYRLRKVLPMDTKIALAHTLLLPILDYADSCYSNVTEEQLNKLERLQNLCIRFIFGLRKYDHVSQYRTRLKWLSIRLRRNWHILSLLYSILFNPVTPHYLKERFMFLGESNSNSYSLRSTDNLQLIIPTHSSSFYSKSFSVQAVRLWNSLPTSIRCAQSLPIFKNLVKAHYLSL